MTLVVTLSYLDVAATAMGAALTVMLRGRNLVAAVFLAFGQRWAHASGTAS